MADSVAPSNVDAFLTNAAWTIHSTYHTVLKASPGVFDIPFLADWNKIGEYSRQHQTDLKTIRENKTHVDYIRKWVIKYWCAKMVSSAKLKAVTKVIHGK